jgi:hypothetical protein
MVALSMLLEIYMRVSLYSIKNMVSVNTHLIMEISIKDHGKMIREKEKVS